MDTTCKSSVLFGGRKDCKGWTGGIWAPFGHLPFLLWAQSWSKKKIKIKNWDWLILALPWINVGLVLFQAFCLCAKLWANNKLMWWITLAPKNNLDIFAPSCAECTSQPQGWTKQCWKLLGKQYWVIWTRNIPFSSMKITGKVQTNENLMMKVTCTDIFDRMWVST